MTALQERASSAEKKKPKVPAEPGGLTASDILTGKVSLVIGVANEHSIAAGFAQTFRDAGAELVLTSREKSMPCVAPVAKEIHPRLLLLLDVETEGSLESVFDQIKSTFGRLDFVLHSIAFCPKQDLHGRIADCSREGFARAMDISVHSFVRMARLAEPLMPNGGCLLTVRYYGAEKVVDHYSIMGPVKADLEATVRYLAAELGPKGIRVNALSPGPLKTRAASGIDHFVIDKALERAPERGLVMIAEVGGIAMGLVNDFARNVTGSIAYVDAGYHVMS